MGDNFYDQISALHKSVRGSNPNAALYWLARMLDGGADPRYLPGASSACPGKTSALPIHVPSRSPTTRQRLNERLGSPEGELALAQAVIYLAVAAKATPDTWPTIRRVLS